MDRHINRIKEVLKEKKQTQVWLGKEVKKSRVAITNYVNNVHQPSLETLRDIAIALDVDIRELLQPTKYFKEEPSEDYRFMNVPIERYENMMYMIKKYGGQLGKIRKVLKEE